MDEKDLAKLGENLAKEGLAKLLADSDMAGHVVEFLENEVGVPKHIAILLSKGLATLAELTLKEGGKAGGKWLNGLAFSWFTKLPGYEQLQKVLGKLITSIKEKQEVKAYLNGERPARGLASYSTLNLDIRVELKNAESLMRCWPDLMPSRRWICACFPRMPRA
jgi:hypothetical protein